MISIKLANQANQPHHKMASAFITMKKKWVLPGCFALLLSIILIASVPIKYTPVKNIFPRYSTWHELSTFHLMKILLVAVPSDVTPVQCTKFTEPGVPRSTLYNIPFKVFPISQTEAKIEKLMQQGHTSLSHFSPLMDKETKVSLLHTFMVMADALEKAGIPFMAVHGALLGMYRFGGVIPWDDDLDIAINVSRWQEVRNVLSCIRGYELFVDPVMRWSFFSKNGADSLSVPEKKYPFVDIFFQAEDDTHIWGLHYVNRRRSIFPKKHMLPLTWGYLDGIKVPVPNNVLEILKLQYVDLNVCASQKNGHLLPPTDVYTVPCSLLYSVYGNFSVKQ